MSKNGRSVSDFDRMVTVLISIALICIVVWDIYNDAQSIDTVHVILIALAMMPWMGSFLNSFKLSASGLEAEFRELKEEADIVIEALSEPEAETENKPDADLAKNFSQDQLKVLSTLVGAKYTLRSWSGIKRDAGMASKTQTLDILGELKNNNLVKVVVGKRTRNNLWSITAEGYRVLQSSEAK